MKLGVIDYGASNIFSVVRALNSLGASTIIVKKPEDFKNTDKLVFPGQGSMGACLKKLSENNLKDSLIDALNNYPFLGICLGLQILFSESEESKGEKGLNIFSEKIKKFSEFEDKSIKAPAVSGALNPSTIACISPLEVFILTFALPSNLGKLSNSLGIE